MKSKDARLQRKADKFLPNIKKKIQETDAIIPIDLAAAQESDEALFKGFKCSFCAKTLKLMSFGSVILHCNTEETVAVRNVLHDNDAFVMYAFCDIACFRFLKQDVFCHKCNKPLSNDHKYDHLYDLFFVRFNSHVIKLTCGDKCKHEIQKEDSSSPELGVKIVCGACGEWKETMPRCPCGNVNYCNVECQKKLWPTHKETCVWQLNKNLRAERAKKTEAKSQVGETKDN
jgi:hypothetical protein